MNLSKRPDTYLVNTGKRVVCMSRVEFEAWKTAWKLHEEKLKIWRKKSPKKPIKWLDENEYKAYKLECDLHRKKRPKSPSENIKQIRNRE